tara:strand:- start:91944 stop:92264 length:321 start_codon:yes stop_codon:yes gene_type:complete
MSNVTQWTVPADHPAFAGHFPGNPTVPGVVLLDIALHAITTATSIDLAICEISSVKFLSPVLPGEHIYIQYTVLESGSIRFEILSDTRKIATGRVINKPSKSTPPV